MMKLATTYSSVLPCHSLIRARSYLGHHLPVTLTLRTTPQDRSLDHYCLCGQLHLGEPTMNPK